VPFSSALFIYGALESRPLFGGFVSPRLSYVETNRPPTWRVPASFTFPVLLRISLRALPTCLHEHCDVYSLFRFPNPSRDGYLIRPGLLCQTRTLEVFDWRLLHLSSLFPFVYSEVHAVPKPSVFVSRIYSPFFLPVLARSSGVDPSREFTLQFLHRAFRPGCFSPRRDLVLIFPVLAFKTSVTPRVLLLLLSMNPPLPVAPAVLFLPSPP